MSEFRKYMHIEHLTSEEVEGIFSEGMLHVFPKLDGSNGSVWLEDGKVCAGSRNNKLTEQWDNAGFYKYVQSNPEFERFLKDHPTMILYGEWLCLAGDTVIRKASGGKGGHGNYMTIKEMYEYRHKKIQDVNYYKLNKTGELTYTSRNKSWWERYGMPSIFSLDEEKDKIRPMKMKDIIYSGVKPVWKLKTRKGYEIKATSNHPFYTPNGYKPLGDLKINDCVAVTSFIKSNPHRRYGVGSNQIKIAQRKYIEEIGHCERCGNPNCLELHHKDQNWRNNDVSNWECLCRDCHKMSHQNIHMDNHYDYEFDKIVSIEYVGEEDCYDICMDESVGEPNFVANNFIVHNCPHTIKDYVPEAWNKFYIFDVFDTLQHKYLPYEDYCQLLNGYGFCIIPLCGMCDLNNICAQEELEDWLTGLLNNNTYLMKEGSVGEGIVLKNYDFVNKYGRMTYAKMVRQAFKVKSRSPNKGLGDKTIEQYIVEKIVTQDYVEHERLKFIDENGKLCAEQLGKFLGIFYAEFIRENIFEIMRIAGKSPVRFDKLKKEVYDGVKLYLIL